MTDQPIPSLLETVRKALQSADDLICDEQVQTQSTMLAAAVSRIRDEALPALDRLSETLGGERE